MLRQVSFKVNFTSTPYSPIAISGNACGCGLKSIWKVSSFSVISAKTSRTRFSNCADDLKTVVLASSVSCVQTFIQDFFKFVLCHTPLLFPSITFFTELAICHASTGGTAFPIVFLFHAIRKGRKMNQEKIGYGLLLA